MNKKQLLEKLGERLPSEETGVKTEDVATTVLQVYADLRLPQLEERLEKYEGSQFKTFGKIEELEEMQNL